MSLFVQIVICLFCFCGSFWFIINALKLLLSLKVTQCFTDKQVKKYIDDFMRGN